MLKIIKLSQILTSKALKADNNKVVRNKNNNKTNKINKFSVKSKNIKKLLKIKKKFAKTRHLKQPIFLNFKTNNVLFIKDFFN